MAGQAKPKIAKPKVISFTASPSTLQASGGSVLLTASTSNGGLCNVAASSLIYGFPDYTTCITGSASTTVNIVPNLGSTPEKFVFTITVKATSGSASAKSTVTVTVEPPPTTLTITPTTSEIAPGGTIAYQVDGFDAHGHNLGLDTDATLSVTGVVSQGNGQSGGDGSCTDFRFGTSFSCTASDIGVYTVRAFDIWSVAPSTSVVTATFTVSALASLMLSPDPSTVAPGSSQVYAVTGLDAASNAIGPDLNAKLTITPDGTCSGFSCSANVPGITRSRPPMALPLVRQHFGLRIAQTWYQMRT